MYIAPIVSKYRQLTMLRVRVPLGYACFIPTKYHQWHWLNTSYSGAQMFIIFNCILFNSTWINVTFVPFHHNWCHDSSWKCQQDVHNNIIMILKSKRGWTQLTSQQQWEYLPKELPQDRKCNSTKSKIN